VTHLTPKRVVLDDLLAEVQGPERGGTCVFMGTVRNGPEESGVTEIEYSAYDAMADAEIDRMLTETEQQWPGVRVALRHRVGRVPVGEASIAIVAAAPHRADAFAACRHVIEEVKRRLPMWKKEFRIDGTTAWVDPSGKAVTHGP
jgi:molybdopterin synthase catalytic subunit